MYYFYVKSFGSLYSRLEINFIDSLPEVFICIKNDKSITKYNELSNYMMSLLAIFFSQNTSSYSSIEIKLSK